MHIEHIKIENFRIFKDVQINDLPSMAVFVGPNGSGKSTLFDIFGFLRDSLRENVHVALGKRGGFKEVVSRESRGPIRFEIKFREEPEDSPLVTYDLSIGLDEHERPIITREILMYRRGQHGRPWRFLDFTKGEGKAIVNEDDYKKSPAEPQREHQRLESPDILAIKGLGQFQKFRVISAIRKLIESWHLSDFHISAARPSQELSHAEHLSPNGENLPLVTRFLFQRYPKVFQQILGRMSQRVPGVSQVEATETIDGRVVLQFKDGTFKDPFVARYVSDGTIKMFAYLVMLYDPQPHPLLCVEEPENQLFPQLLRELVEEFREYSRRGGQVLISTHSPEFLNGAQLEEIFWLEKLNGFTTIHRAQGFEKLKELIKEGDLPGALWKQGLFTGALT